MNTQIDYSDPRQVTYDFAGKTGEFTGKTVRELPDYMLRYIINEERRPRAPNERKTQFTYLIPSVRVELKKRGILRVNKPRASKPTSFRNFVPTFFRGDLNEQIN